MNGDELSDDRLLYLVGTTDKELFDEGVPIGLRAFEVPARVMKRLGYISYVFADVGTPDVYNRIYSAFCSIYRPQDVALGGHIGVFMYRDVFARIGVPHIFGQVNINPFEFVDLTPVQLRIIQTEPDQMGIYLDQFSDVADVQYGSAELRPPFSDGELVKRFVGLARLHLHSASAVLTGGYDFRGAVQSALLATELALKAAAASIGLDEDQIRRKFGHSAEDIVDFVAPRWSGFDADRVRRVVQAQPKYVVNRYASEQPGRRDVGHLVMGAQYIVAEVVRQMSDRDFRREMRPPMSRTYPA